MGLRGISIVVLAACACFTCPSFSEAQGLGCRPELNPDRPGATNAYLPINPMCLQVETSTELARADGASAQSFPTTLRLGLTESVELRMESGLFSLGYSGGTERSDVAIGTKVLLIDPEEDGAVPGLGFTLVAVVPGSGGKLSATAPRFDLLADWGLPSGWALSVNAGIEVGVNDNDKRNASFPLSAVLGWNVPGTNDTVGVFVDSGAQLTPSGPDDAWSQAFGGGVVWFVLPTVQLDLSGSADTIGGGGWWVAAGVSWSMSLAGSPNLASRQAPLAHDHG